MKPFWGFDRWLIVRSGYRQRIGSWHNGCTQIAAELSALYGGNGNRVELQGWDASPTYTADYIHQLSPVMTRPKVAIFAYSWGVGYGFVKLAKELRAHGIDVEQAVLCDPVYHGLFKWRALIPKKMFGIVKITVPSNVKEVHWLRQNVNKPAGHNIVAESKSTIIHEAEWIDRPHTDMDNSSRFRELCMQAAERIMS